MLELTTQEIETVSGADGTYGGYGSYGSVIWTAAMPDFGQVQTTKAALAQYLANNPGSNSSDFYKY